MDKLKESFKKIWLKFKSFNKILKISIITMMITILIALGSLFFYNSATKYQVLFSNLESSDAQVVINKLSESKVDMKIEGNTILVPKDQVDKLRLEIAPELSNGSQGYELMDSGNSFGMTDEEFQIKKVRMLQGELEKTIKSFPQIETARVHISQAKDSVFVEDSEPGKAAVYLKLLKGNSLTKEQVKSIVALVSGSTENIPKENIEVIDDNMNLLSEGLNDDSDFVSSENIEKQYLLKKKYEEDIEKSIISLLEPIVGKGKVKGSVNVDLDFNSVQKTETIIDPNKVIVSQQVIKENNTDGVEDTSGSVIDNNMENTIDDEEQTSSSSSKEEVSTNYESGKTEIKTINAPGEVKRLTASVFVDGNIDQNVQSVLETSVSNAIGLNNDRGDSVSVVGMTFDPISKQEAQNEFDAINEALAKESRNRIILYSVLGIFVLILIIVIITVLLRRKSNVSEEEEKGLLDIVIDDRTTKSEPKVMPHIDFDDINPKAHIENEIKKYATEKPEQVVDIIKSWLTESER